MITSMILYDMDMEFKILHKCLRQTYLPFFKEPNNIIFIIINQI